MDARLEVLREIAEATVEGARVEPGGRLPGRTNATGRTLRLPAAAAGYPAFWLRDAAMMLGAGLVGADEVEGWVRLIASCQAPPDGLSLARGLQVPPWSIPDHITVEGAPCWFPGAYDGDDQGDGTYGFLPPADDAFYYVGMVAEHCRLARGPELFDATVATPAGEMPLWQSCGRAFDSVATDAAGLVVCSAEPGQERVDWGFCDTVRKTGACLMPSLLRWRAALDLRDLFAASGREEEAARLGREAARLQAGVPRVFCRGMGAQQAMLVSATGLGCQEDVWAEAFAVHLGILPRDIERAVAHRLLHLYRAGGTVLEGQVRHVPFAKPDGGFWQSSTTPKGTYQNGAWWGTPTGWVVSALGKVNRAAATAMLGEFVDHLEANRAQGAPWECFNPAAAHYQNPGYCATVALPLAVLSEAEPG